MGITHVTGVPDSTFGPWFDRLRTGSDIRLVPVCREGEAWAVAAGLSLGGAVPLIMIQCTGLFESGDSLRNAIHDFKLPLYAFVGYRNYLNRATAVGDTTLAFTEPVLRAWDVDYILVNGTQEFATMREHYTRCQREGRAGIALIAEGRG
jgi:sulfopyruvate decarboxylase TPP-binding subunit